MSKDLEIRSQRYLDDLQHEIAARRAPTMHETETITDKQQFIDEEQCWHAVIARERTADGNFVFAVHSTGIYCRPSCPARRPLRKNVTFFLQPVEAELAGFRPCKRCHPQQEHVPAAQAGLIEDVCHYIQTHLDAPLHLADLGEQFHLSPFHLQRTFKRIKGVSPRQYAESYRLEQFKTHLQDGKSVTDALYDAGYQSSSNLYEHIPTRLGMTPTTYRKGGKGMHISYDIIETALGYVLIAATTQGVTAVRFGDAETALENELAREYPEAQRERDAQKLHPWMTLLQLHLQGQPAQEQIPIDVHATTFQWKVWKALQAIPMGSTRSYSDIAHAIGHPEAARAVAQACAHNPVAVFVPCHRIVRSNGELGGYHWGVERKKQLLEMEQSSARENTDAAVLTTS